MLSIGYGPGIHAVNASGSAGDPVNTLTGAFDDHTSDLALTGIGVPFSFERSYASNDGDAGRLGPGWRDSYSAFLVVDPGGDVTLHGENGQIIHYTKQVDGSFAGASPGVRSTLAAAGGGYDLTRHDQVVYHFDANGRLASMRDRNGNGLTFSYDGSAQLTQITDASGRQITLSYDGSGLLSEVATPAPDSRSVGYGYTNGRLTSVTDVRGKTWTYAYDGGGRLASLQDPNGHYRYRNTFDQTSGRLTEQLDALDNKTTYGWSDATQTATVTDAADKQWKDVYKNGALVERIDPLARKTYFGYDDDLNLSLHIDPRSNRTSMDYDLRGNLVRRTAAHPLSYVETWKYDGKNDVTGFTDRRRNTTSYEYDAAGNLTKKTGPDPDGSGPLAAPVTSYGRDAAGTGLPTSLTDPRNKTTSYVYNGSGDLTSATTPLWNKTSYGYDGAGRLTSVVEARGNVTGANPADYTTTYTYDAAGHRLSEQDALGNETTFGYDDAGNLKTVTRAVGTPRAQTWSYDYNAADERVKETAPDNTTSQAEYDARGHVTRTTSALSRATSYGYDDAGQLTSLVTPRGNVTGADASAFTWSYRYDGDGNVAAVVDPTGGETDYTYDAVNRRASTSLLAGPAPLKEYTATVVADSPLIYWHLDEALGTTAADSSGNGRAGTYINNPTLALPGTIYDDASVGLLGTQYVQKTAPGLPTGNAPRTLEIWFKTTSSASQTCTTTAPAPAGRSSAG